MAFIPLNPPLNSADELYIPVVTKETFILRDVFFNQDAARNKVRTSLLDYSLS